MKKTIALLFLLPLSIFMMPGAGPSGNKSAGYKYWSAAELKSMSRTLAHKSNARTSNQDLANWGADRALVVHRTGTGSAELHERDSDLMVIVSGAGTLVIGGSMPGSKTTAPGEVRGPSITGGDRQKIGPGDILHIPPKTPHQVVLEPGSQITYFTLKVKE